MSFSDFPKDLRALIDSGLDWFDACRHPIAHCNELLSLSSDKEKITKSLQIWIVIFVLTLILQLPLLKIVGIEWGTVGYHFPNFLVLTALFILTGAVLHWGLRIYGVPSQLSDLIVMYTTLVGVYSPIWVLVAYPSVVQSMRTLRIAKVQNLSFLQALAFVFKSQAAAIDQSYMGLVVAVTVFPVIVVGFSLLALMARRVSSAYSVPKSKVLSCFAFSLIVLLFPVSVVTTLLYYFFIYTFIQT